jgi:hypothetical protein
VVLRPSSPLDGGCELGVSALPQTPTNAIPRPQAGKHRNRELQPNHGETARFPWNGTSVDTLKFETTTSTDVPLGFFPIRIVARNSILTLFGERLRCKFRGVSRCTQQ